MARWIPRYHSPAGAPQPGQDVGAQHQRNVKLFEDHQIVQSGPYAFVRNPMYFGWYVAMLGLMLVYPTWVVLVFFIF